MSPFHIQHKTSTTNKRSAGHDAASQQLQYRQHTLTGSITDHTSGDCVCGGTCPQCAARRKHQEDVANQAVTSLSKSGPHVHAIAKSIGNRNISDGIVSEEIRDTLKPHTGTLPSNLTLRSGTEVDRILVTRGARGLAKGNEIWVGGPSLAPGAGGFANVFVHEAAHVAGRATKGTDTLHFDNEDPLNDEWYEAALRHAAQLEAAETGEGRQRTLDAIAAMSEHEIKWKLPGIAFRAHDRGDIPLAIVAARKILDFWLTSGDYPATLTSTFGPDGSVDNLLDRTNSAFNENRLILGGVYLAIAKVQLIRASNATVQRRITEHQDNAGVAMIADGFLPMQIEQENNLLLRVTRAQAILDTHGAAVLDREADAEMQAFESMAEWVHQIEDQTGQGMPSDLGTGGRTVSVEANFEPGNQLPTRRRPPLPTIEGESSNTESLTQQPIEETLRAEESTVNETHPYLEGVAVFQTTSAPTTFALISSPRYAIAGTLASAHRKASELFGRRTSVIVEDVHARDLQTGRRQIRYLVLALSIRINPPSNTLGQNGKVVGYGDLQMFVRPADPRYFFLALTVGDWLFFGPNLLNYIQKIHQDEANLIQTPVDIGARRTEVFGPIDALIAANDIQDAANQLTFIGARGFQLVDTETKILYIVTLLKAFTFQANEETVVDIFRSLADAGELRTVLHGIHHAEELHSLHADLQSAFPSLLMAVAQVVGSQSYTATQARNLLTEIGLFSPLPGIELRADGSVTVGSNFTAEFVAAFEELINTLSSAIMGVVEIVLDPEAFLKGIGKLLYFVGMTNLASKGHPEAMRYVTEIVNGISRQLGTALGGLAALQENVPDDVEFVRDIQRSIEWRIVWEVLGLFIGVGEAIALVDAVKGGRAASAISDMAAGLRRASSPPPAAGSVDEIMQTADAMGDARRAGRTGDTVSDAPSARHTSAVGAQSGLDVPGDIIRIERIDLANIGSHRVVISRVGETVEIWMCTHCGRMAGRIEAALEGVSSTGPTRSLHTRLTRLRDRVHNIENQLARGSLTVDNLPRELNQISAHLRDLSVLHPRSAELLSFGNLPFSPGMRRFISDTAQPATRHWPASEYSRRKHVKGTTNTHRQNVSRNGGEGQYFAEVDGTRVTDATIAQWEREALQLAREGLGRVDVRGANDYHCYVRLPHHIGYAGGRRTKVMRVEWTTGREVHSHPRPETDLHN